MENGEDNTLSPSESTDSDELRNHDGDTVVDPPEGWSEADRFGMTAREQRDGDSLDNRLAAEEPEVSSVNEASAGPGIVLPGELHRGQVAGTPEDGDSLYEVIDE